LSTDGDAFIDQFQSFKVSGYGTVLSGVERTGPTGGGPARVARGEQAIWNLGTL
jgi:hypothetical protein